jgi:hypothetical protein
VLIGALLFVAFQLQRLLKAQGVQQTKLPNENMPEIGVNQWQPEIAELRGQVSVRHMAELNG